MATSPRRSCLVYGRLRALALSAFARKRYSMLVEDGVVKALHVEDAPGKADVSGAEAMLRALA